MDQKYIVTLELSGTQIKGAVASIGKHPNGTPTLPTIEAIVTEDDSECVQYGRVQNLITAANLTNSVLRRLQNEPILDDGTINGAYVAIGGRSLSSEQTSAEITLPNERVITKEILESLFIEASKNASPNKRVLKVLPRKFYVDNQTILIPVGALGSKLRGDFTLVTCSPINQRNIDLILSDKERVDMPVKEYVVTQLALGDLLLDEDKQRGCILVDLGHQTTTISIYKDRALQYLVTLPMGSQNITRDIAMGMNVTLEKAEASKCVNGDAMPKKNNRTDEISRMNSYVEARAYEIAANINANIGYAKYKSADLPAGIILTGRGSRLKNFDNLLSNISNLPVKHAKVPSNVNFAFNTDNIHPEDFMSTIAIILNVSRNPQFESCITFKAADPEPETVVVEETVVTQMPETPSDYTPATPKAPAREVNDDNWDDDDPDDTTLAEEKPKKPKANILTILKERIGKIVSSDNLDDDEDLG